MVARKREDFEKASFSLRRLAALFPENQWIREDLGEAMSFKIDSQPKTYVFYESGRAPVRVEKRFDLPVVFFATNARIPYLGLALLASRPLERFSHLFVLEPMDWRNPSAPAFSRTWTPS